MSRYHDSLNIICLCVYHVSFNQISQKLDLSARFNAICWETVN